MIQLKIKGQIIYFNLKDTDREKGFRDAWYAMSDMPQYLNKHINIVTDKNEALSYTVGEIEDCNLIVGKYTEVKKLTKDENSNFENFRGSPEEETDENNHSKNPEIKAEDSLDKIFDQYFQSSSEMSSLIKEICKKTFQGVPPKTVEKFFKFTTEIMSLGYSLIPNNEIVNDIIGDILTGPEDEDVTKYIKRYVEYCKRKKHC